MYKNVDARLHLVNLIGFSLFLFCLFHPSFLFFTLLFPLFAIPQNDVYHSTDKIYGPSLSERYLFIHASIANIVKADNEVHQSPPIPTSFVIDFRL